MEDAVDKFEAMQMFVRVIEKGSFSAVAKERGIGQPAVSKQISGLEDELGTELIHRTSRSIALTEAGREFYESSLRILDDFENATSRIGRGQTAPKGLIRVTVAPTFARLHMVSKLPAFFAAYPDMAVEMAASETPTTIIEDGFDLAIHSGDLPDSTLVARRFTQTMTILVATPQYLTRFGAPESPEELKRFRSVVLALDRTRRVLSPQESFEPAISNRCGWVSLNIWGLPRRQHGSSPQNSEKAPSSVF
jgi:DNA-binding transcriptional LysR family regulator